MNAARGLSMDAFGSFLNEGHRGHCALAMLV